MGLLLTVLAAAAAYLIGSVNSSILISRAVLGRDIRESGSGNAGATNMLRTMGKKYAVVTLIIDILKGTAAVLLAKLAVRLGAYPSAPYIAAVCAVLGHNFPVFFGFKGGKGVAASLGAVLVLDWRIALIALAVAIVVMAVTRYVSLGSVTAAVVFAALETVRLVVMTARAAADIAGAVCVIILAGLIAAGHHANIGRLIRGEENKLSFKRSEEE